MKPKFLVYILLFLPIFSCGQGFYKISEHYISSHAASDIEHISMSYNPYEINFYLQDESYGILKYLDDSLEHRRIIDDEYHFESILEDEEIVYAMRRGRVNSYKIKDGNYVKQKSRKLPSKYKNQSLIPTYGFQDEDYIYFICYYNSSSVINHHDNSYWFKIDKKNLKIVKHKELFIGKEILLAPFSYQLIAFNTKQFVLASPVKHQLYFINKSFEITDSLLLDSSLGHKKQAELDSIFPDKHLYYYLHKPKDVIDRAVNSTLIESDLLVKLTYLNDSILAATTVLEYRKHYKLRLYDLKNNQVILEKVFDFEDELYGNFAYTTKLYFTQDNKFATLSLVANSDSTEIYKVNVYGFSASSPIDVRKLAPFSIYNKDLDIIDPSHYKAIVLTDYLFCKSCYMDFGIGEEVLVLSMTENLERPRLNTNYYYMKRDWNIKGDIGFIDKASFNAMRKFLQTNSILPLESDTID